jgi:hypothetical protein
MQFTTNSNVLSEELLPVCLPSSGSWLAFLTVRARDLGLSTGTVACRIVTVYLFIQSSLDPSICSHHLTPRLPLLRYLLVFLYIYFQRLGLLYAFKVILIPHILEHTYQRTNRPIK